MPKILLIHSDPQSPARESVELWRIIRPFNELKKHVDWQIDSIPSLIDLDKVDEVNLDLLAGKIHRHLLDRLQLFKNYDIVWSSYVPDGSIIDMMKFATAKYGTKFVLDVDDNMFAIPKHNHIWVAAGLKGIRDLQYSVGEVDHLVTTTPILKKELAKHRKGLPIYVLPNLIGADYKPKAFDNGDKVIITFFGSVTHKHDLVNTGFIEALQNLMHKYKNVHATTIGLQIGAYLPRQRYSHNPGKSGKDWLKVWPTINADIAVAPLEDNAFNRSKSNIKFLETAMIPAAFVASNVEPYKGTVENSKTGLLVNNDSESWFEALEALVLDAKLRKSMAAAAKKEVMGKYHVKNNWEVLKGIVENVVSA